MKQLILLCEKRRIWGSQIHDRLDSIVNGDAIRVVSNLDQIATVELKALDNKIGGEGREYWQVLDHWVIVKHGVLDTAVVDGIDAVEEFNERDRHIGFQLEGGVDVHRIGFNYKREVP